MDTQHNFTARVLCGLGVVTNQQSPEELFTWALNQRLNVLCTKLVHLNILLSVNFLRIFMRQTLPKMSMVIISLSCLIVKQVVKHPGQF